MSAAEARRLDELVEQLLELRAIMVRVEALLDPARRPARHLRIVRD